MTAVLEGVRTWSTSAPASSDGLYSAATASNEAIAGRTGVLERRWVTAGMAPPLAPPIHSQHGHRLPSEIQGSPGAGRRKRELGKICLSLSGQLPATLTQ